MQPWQDPEIDKIRDKYAEFARTELAGDWRERDKEGDFSLERWRKAADFGVLGLCMPEEYGGTPSPVTHMVAAYEGLGIGCRDTGFFFAMLNQHAGIQMALRLSASEELQAKYLPDLISGNHLAAYCFTEEVGGSDAFMMETMAVKEGDGYRINGRKRYITNSPNSDRFLVFAKTSEKRNPFGLTAFMVDLEMEGVSHGEEFEKVGFRTTPMGEVIFDNVFVPKENMVGSRGGGLRLLAESTGWERAVVLANTLGPMHRAVEVCLERAKTRVAYDKPIGAFQQVSSKVADMIMRQKLARQTIYDLASRLGNGKSIQPYLQDAAIAKLFVSENYVQVQMAAVQLFGVRGILMEYPFQQDLRDSVGSTIWAGTSESLRNTIAKLAGLPVD